VLCLHARALAQGQRWMSPERTEQDVGLETALNALPADSAK
jgi:hypothetical protein